MTRKPRLYAIEWKSEMNGNWVAYDALYTTKSEAVTKLKAMRQQTKLSWDLRISAYERVEARRG